MKKHPFVYIKPVYLLIFCQLPLEAWSWGFFAHKQINRYAITTLPPGIFAFYKAHLTYLTEKAVNPDRRRYVIKGEAPKHFIDLEVYYSSLLNGQKLSFHQAVEQYGDKIVAAHGHLPWAILNAHKQLTEAFQHKDTAKILKCSADLGHYIADAHVPLHTTQNYNGQMTGQEGLHALWETRLPVLFFDTYTLFVGQAVYIQDLVGHIWDIVRESHALVNTVLDLEKQLSAQYPEKYSFEQTGNLLKKQYSIAFSTAYHQALQGQVEARLQKSIIEVGSFWFTAWINAGAPSLNDLHTAIAMQDEEEPLLQAGIILEGVRTCGDE
ncbi:zinc dependent phospholipase C family protein [Cardinium endosymbiont of Sogatella furcifera]|uniref:zinc dependent phospholipase C family protein n=1 Tax=Cardinium endosymbiont of Sogatella furcifera TaxID=650378 RepID=UPI000E0D7B48|nr:zinc dependent phospholipase C family protein [Cardinium endosymbiont of Sogatella furcifera]